MPTLSIHSSATAERIEMKFKKKLTTQIRSPSLLNFVSQLFPVAVPHTAEMSRWCFFSFVPEQFFVRRNSRTAGRIFMM
jgi:hypothetical protein